LKYLFIKISQGCYADGFYLEGARWDIEKGCLDKSRPKILVEQLPLMKIIPIEINQLNLMVMINKYKILFLVLI
jgi:dynein heavy chain